LDLGIEPGIRALREIGTEEVERIPLAERPVDLRQPVCSLRFAFPSTEIAVGFAFDERGTSPLAGASDSGSGGFVYCEHILTVDLLRRDIEALRALERVGRRRVGDRCRLAE